PRRRVCRRRTATHARRVPARSPTSLPRRSMPGGGASSGATHRDALSSCAFSAPPARLPHVAAAARVIYPSITYRHSELDLVEVHGGIGVDPALVVAEAHRPDVVDVPAHTDAGAVHERVGGAGVLPGSANVAVPGVPPAAAHRRAVRDVGINEGVTDRRRDVRRD